MTIPNGKSLSKLRVTDEQRVFSGQDCLLYCGQAISHRSGKPDGKEKSRNRRTIDVDIEIDAASVLERLQTDDVGLVRKVVELAAVDLVWRWRAEEGEVRLEQVEEGPPGEVPVMTEVIQAEEESARRMVVREKGGGTCK